MIRKIFGYRGRHSSKPKRLKAYRKPAIHTEESGIDQLLSSDDSFMIENRKYNQANDNSVPNVSADVLAYTHVDEQLLKDLGFSKPTNGQKGTTHS